MAPMCNSGSTLADQIRSGGWNQLAGGTTTLSATTPASVSMSLTMQPAMAPMSSSGDATAQEISCGALTRSTRYL